MNRVTKLELEAAENRRSLAALLDVETRSDEQTAELEHRTSRARAIDSELAAARVVDPEPETRTEDAEGRELRDLRGRVEFGHYVQAALSMRPADGAARELNAALGIPEGRFPLEMFAPERRAAIDGDAGANQGTWLDRLFDGTAAQRLGITFTPVSPGIAAYPVMTSTAAVSQRQRAEAAQSGVFTAVVTEMKPKRAAVEGIYSIEDNARLPGLGDAILRDMSNAMAEGIDRKVFTGDAGGGGTEADIAGLTTAGITEVTLTQTNKVKADETLKLFVAMVDGMHASGMDDVRVVASEGANTLWYGTVHAAAVQNQTVAQFLMASGLSWGVRGGIEVNTSAGDFGAFVGLARGIEGAARAAVWSAGELIRDPYSGAKKGEVSLTLNYLWDFAVPRVANFRRLKYVA